MIIWKNDQPDLNQTGKSLTVRRNKINDIFILSWCGSFKLNCIFSFVSQSVFVCVCGYVFKQLGAGAYYNAPFELSDGWT